MDTLVDTPTGYSARMKTFLIHAITTSPAALPLAENIICEDYAQDRILRGRAEVVALLDAFFIRGFTNVQVNLRTALTDESSAVFEFVFRGLHVAPFLDIPATQRAVELPMVIICHLTNEQVQRAALYYDAGVLLRQLGLAL